MKTAWISCLLALLLTLPLRAEQMKELGPWQVHYSAFNSSFLQPDIAAAAGLTRSKTVGILNVAALRNGQGQTARVSGNLKNLLGQSVELQFRQVLESDAVYYLAEFPLRQREILTFNINVQIGDAAPHTLTFSQEVFPDQ